MKDTLIFRISITGAFQVFIKKNKIKYDFWKSKFVTVCACGTEQRT